MYLAHFIWWLAGRWPCMGRGGTHSLLSTEEIEKKLNIYHKGAKIWKMLIFCQVEPEMSGEPALPLHMFTWWACPCVCGRGMWTSHRSRPSPPEA